MTSSGEIVRKLHFPSLTLQTYFQLLILGWVALGEISEIRKLKEKDWDLPEGCSPRLWIRGWVPAHSSRTKLYITTSTTFLNSSVSASVYRCYRFEI
jgi:hypothetical protein